MAFDFDRMDAFVDEFAARMGRGWHVEAMLRAPPTTAMSQALALGERLLLEGSRRRLPPDHSATILAFPRRAND